MESSSETQLLGGNGNEVEPKRIYSFESPWPPRPVREPVPDIIVYRGINPYRTNPYDDSFPGITYYSIYPETAMHYVGRYEQPEVTGTIESLSLGPETKLWNPDADKWPNSLSYAKRAIKQSWEEVKATCLPAEEKAETAFLDTIKTVGGAELQKKLVSQLRSLGFQGIRSGNEFAMWDGATGKKVSIPLRDFKPEEIKTETIIAPAKPQLTVRDKALQAFRSKFRGSNEEK